MDEATLMALAQVIENSRTFSVAHSSHSDDEVSFILRAQVGKTAREDRALQDHVETLFTLIVRAEEGTRGYTSHYCKRFLRRPTTEGTSEVVFGWHVQYRSTNMKEALPHIRRVWEVACKGLAAMPKPRVPVAPPVDETALPKPEITFTVDSLLGVNSKAIDAKAGRVKHEPNVPR